MSDPIIIKKYANRRLYNTSSSTYVTLEDLAQLVKEGKDFEVVDAKTGDDMTRPVLAQIIFEQESQGAALLPLNFLRQLIRFYDHTLQQAVPHYLETAMEVFSENQHQFQEQTKDMLTPFGFGDTVEALEQLRQHNLDLIQQSWQMFNPFMFGETKADREEKIKELSAQVEQLNAQINQLKSAD